MTTLIAVYSSDGLVGRCDARCYLANQPDCDCICGGRNHGAGVQKAIDNTRELAQHWLCEYARKEGLTRSRPRSIRNVPRRPCGVKGGLDDHEYR